VEDGAMRATPQRRRDALIFSVAGNPRDPQVRPVAFEAVQHSLIIFMHSRVTQSAFINRSASADLRGDVARLLEKFKTVASHLGARFEKTNSS